MKQTDLSPSSNPARSEWKLLCEMRLPISVDDGETIYILLQRKLEPLNLQTELVHRIAKSIQEIVERDQAREIGLEPMQLCIFVPKSYPDTASTWGFFRIEKMAAGSDISSRSHAVDLYLYPEGK